MKLQILNQKMAQPQLSLPSQKQLHPIRCLVYKNLVIILSHIPHLIHFIYQAIVWGTLSKYIQHLFFSFLGLHLRRMMEVPRLGVESEVQLLAYTTSIASPDLSRICDLHHSSRQCRILNTLSKARDRTCNLMVPSRIH